MVEENTYTIEFLKGEMDVDLTPTITRHFVKHGVSLQWYEDDSKTSKSLDGNKLIYLHLTFNRLYKYSMVFEVLDGFLRIPKGSIDIGQEKFYEIIIGFVNLINGHVKVYTKDSSGDESSKILAYEYKNGHKIYDLQDKSHSESTILMLIDFYLAELQEALNTGNEEKAKEITESLNSYKQELERY